MIDKESKCYKKIGDGKDQFASEVVPNLDQAKFRGFECIFDTLSSILQTAQEG